MTKLYTLPLPPRHSETPYTGDTGYSRHTGHSPILRDGVTEETQDTEDSAHSSPVRAIRDAVLLALRGEMDENCLFRFCRCLRSFEETAGAKIGAGELQGIFAQWWILAANRLPPDASREEYELLFIATFPKARVPLGANALARATRLADDNPLPSVCERHEPRIARLLAVCWHLSDEGRESFFISVRSAAGILKTTNKFLAAAAMGGFVRDGALVLESKGTQAGRKASRYRFT